MNGCHGCEVEFEVVPRRLRRGDPSWRQEWLIIKKLLDRGLLKANRAISLLELLEVQVLHRLLLVC